MKQSAAQHMTRSGYGIRWSFQCLVLLLLSAMSMSLSAGCTFDDYRTCPTGDPANCEEPEDSPGVGVQSCDLHDFAEAPIGICVPHVDAGWHTALVKLAHKYEGKPRCPRSAAWAGLWGEEIVPMGAEPRYVVGCSVFPLATCGSTNWACVPYEPGYPACVPQSGMKECPAGAYPKKIMVLPDGGGEPTLVCCGDEEDIE